MPIDAILQRRDRAVVAFTLLSAARDNTVASLSLKQVDVTTGTVFQDAASRPDEEGQKMRSGPEPARTNDKGHTFNEQEPAQYRPHCQWCRCR